MKKILTAAVAALGIVMCSYADEAVADDHGEGFECGRFSVRCGYFSPLGWVDDVSPDGVAVEGELIFRPYNNLAFGIRGTVGGAYEDFDYYSPDRRKHHPQASGELTYAEINAAGQVYLSLFRNDNIDLYITGGVYLDIADYEYEYYGTTWRDDYTVDDDCSTVGFLAGAGIELMNDKIGIRLEADYYSKPDYGDTEWMPMEEEKGQLQLSGTLMLFVSDDVSLDFSGRYFTKWENLYVMFGLTVIF